MLRYLFLIVLLFSAGGCAGSSYTASDTNGRKVASSGAEFSDKCTELKGKPSLKSSCFIDWIKAPRVNERPRHSRESAEEVSKELMEACSLSANDERATMSSETSAMGTSYFCFISID